MGTVGETRYFIFNRAGGAILLIRRRRNLRQIASFLIELFYRRKKTIDIGCICFGYIFWQPAKKPFVKNAPINAVSEQITHRDDTRKIFASGYGFSPAFVSPPRSVVIGRVTFMTPRRFLRLLVISRRTECQKKINNRLLCVRMNTATSLLHQ